MIIQQNPLKGNTIKGNYCLKSTSFLSRSLDFIRIPLYFYINLYLTTYGTVTVIARHFIRIKLKVQNTSFSIQTIQNDHAHSHLLLFALFCPTLGSEHTGRSEALKTSTRFLIASLISSYMVIPLHDFPLYDVQHNPQDRTAFYKNKTKSPKQV